MIAQLLFGSIVLPLGDFSLIRELPRMYHAYEKVVSPDEKGVLDFIGDYLLQGKDLLNHNQQDGQSKPGTLQFQGSPTFAVTLQQSLVLNWSACFVFHTKPSVPLHSGALSDYYPSFFRPPLA